ncbi:MAG: c-type cytochrome [Kiloniellales bacterium]|nr:c-type cytochrome [Kiloniellales bacterium]
MSRSLKVLLLSAILAASTASLAAAQGTFGFGREATPEEIAGWNIDVRPDGQGLPEGSGTALDGEEIFLERCSACHGEFGEAVGRYPVLMGGEDTLEDDDPVKTVGSYWPYASTLWDYIYRAMPFGEAQTLSADETYAVTAYVLYINDVIEEDAVLDQNSLGAVEMPNRDGFIDDQRPDTPSAKPCMKDCKAEVEIVARARILDVTPDEAEDAGQADPASGDAASPAAGPDPAQVAAGEKVFRKCKACHQVGDRAKNRIGPHLNQLFGRVAGGLDDFRYSKAMEAKGGEGLAWNGETLGAFLEAPKAYVPKTKMAFAGLKKQADRDAIIAYLRSYGD